MANQLIKSCHLYLKEAKQVEINDQQISKVRDLLTEAKSNSEKERKPALRFPLAFKSTEDEVNFLSLISLLKFGSGFEKLFSTLDKDLEETMLFGAIGMYISTDNLDRKFLETLTVNQVSQFFSFPLDKEEELSTGIYISKPCPLYEFAELIVKTLKTSSEELENLGYQNFGQFVLQHLHDSKNDSSTTSAVYLVNQLAQNFSAFDDSIQFKGDAVLFHQKAQYLALSLHDRFKEDLPEKFDFSDINEIGTFGDHIIPSILESIGVLKYSATLSECIKSGKLLKSDWENELRASAIVSCSMIVGDDHFCSKVELSDFLKEKKEEFTAEELLQLPVVRKTWFY